MFNKNIPEIFPDNPLSPWAPRPECEVHFVFKSGAELTTLCAMTPEHFIQVWDSHLIFVRVPIYDIHSAINIRKSAVDCFSVKKISVDEE